MFSQSIYQSRSLRRARLQHCFFSAQNLQHRHLVLPKSICVSVIYFAKKHLVVSHLERLSIHTRSLVKTKHTFKDMDPKITPSTWSTLLLPDRPFPNFRARASGYRPTVFISKTLIDGFKSSEAVKNRVSELVQLRIIMACVRCKHLSD